MKRISLKNQDGKQVFSVAIKSLKHDRQYVLGLFKVYPEATHAEYQGRIYNAGDIYRAF